MEVEKILRQSMLYDFYGELLTEHQKRIYEDIVFQDMSYTEVGEMEGISRQGVYDLIKRCDKILEEYEEKLKLVEKFRNTKQKVAKIQKIAAGLKRQMRILPWLAGLRKWNSYPERFWKNIRRLEWHLTVYQKNFKRYLRSCEARVH